MVLACEIYITVNNTKFTALKISFLNCNTVDLITNIVKTEMSMILRKKKRARCHSFSTSVKDDEQRPTYNFMIKFQTVNHM